MRKDKAARAKTRTPLEVAYDDWLATLTDAQRGSIPPPMEFDKAKRSRTKKRDEVSCSSVPEVPREEDSEQWRAVRFQHWCTAHPLADEEQQLDAWRTISSGRVLVDEVEVESDESPPIAAAIRLRPDGDVYIPQAHARAVCDAVIGVPVQRLDRRGRKHGTYMRKTKMTAKAKALIAKNKIDVRTLRALAKGAR